MAAENVAAETLPPLIDLGRGTNQTGVRLYNERLALSLIRRHGSLPKAEIARLTGLSAQTISVIVRQLEADGLLLKEPKQRGRIGQPSVPLSLNPDGAFFLGLKIGRRSSDLVLLDFLGGVRGSLHETYRYPTPAHILDFTARGSAALVSELPSASRKRIAGLGVAAPFEIWNWAEQIGAPREVLEAWRSFDVGGGIAQTVEWPVYFCNDATAACGAELVLGNPAHYRDFLYVFVGSFIGGGIVLNGSLYPGRAGNAGALGSMPVVALGGAPQQLIGSASLHGLEVALAKADRDPGMLWRNPDDWGEVGPPLDTWLEQATSSLALAVVSATAVLDFEAVIVDGALPPPVRAQLVARIAAKIEACDRQGLSPIVVAEGTVGSGARAIGGACLPLLANFTRDREVLFKESL
jgi:predicted NBD/HSP70 family sugar kinase